MLTAEQLVKRLIALIPPRGLHLTNFHGVLAPAAAARPVASRAVAPSSTPVPKHHGEKKRPRIDWATLLHRTFACDAWKCPVVVGDGRNYCTALFALDAEMLAAVAQREGIPADPAHARINDILQALVAETNSGLAPFEQIKTFRVSPAPFTVDGCELTASLKVNATWSPRSTRR